MEAKTIQERIRIAGRQLLPWKSMEIDDMERACAIIDTVAAEFGDDVAYNPATHVVVSRETAEIGGNACLWLSQDIDLPMEHRMDFHAADMDFRAALEEK